VSFEIDANGILKVSAADKASGASESIQINNSKGRLSEEEIERMVREAEEFASEDEAQRKKIEALNQLQNYIWSLKSGLSDTDGLGSKLSESDKSTVQTAVKEATEWVDENGSTATAEEFEEKMAELQAAVGPIVSQAGSSSGGSSQDEDLHSHDEL
jgi:heat shock protein 5